jgi:uncharacterized protein YoxC
MEEKIKDLIDAINNEKTKLEPNFDTIRMLQQSLDDLLNDK